MESVAEELGLGPIDQISFAVENVDEAVPRYTAMFGGPFTVFDVEQEVTYRGEPTTTSLRLGFGRSGDVEVELVEVVSGEWPTLDWLREHGEGLHHLRYRVDDVDRTVADLERAGCQVTLASTGSFSYAYLETPQLNGMTIEILQSGDPTAG